MHPCHVANAGGRAARAGWNGPGPEPPGATRRPFGPSMARTARTRPLLRRWGRRPQHLATMSAGTAALDLAALRATRLARSGAAVPAVRQGRTSNGALTQNYTWAGFQPVSFRCLPTAILPGPVALCLGVPGLPTVAHECHAARQRPLLSAHHALNRLSWQQQSAGLIPVAIAPHWVWMQPCGQRIRSRPRVAKATTRGIGFEPCS